MTPTPAPKKRRKPVQLNARAMKDLRAMGFTADKVEQTLPRCFVTRDAFGFGDILACRPGVGVLLIQVTSGSNRASRRTKIYAEPRARLWLRSGGRIELWTYRKGGKAGTRKLWQLTREEIKESHLPMEPPEDGVTLTEAFAAMRNAEVTK